MTRVRYPRLASCRPVAAARLVFPTPPLPLNNRMRIHLDSKPAIRRPHRARRSPIPNPLIPLRLCRRSEQASAVSWNYMKFLWCALLCATALSAQTFSGAADIDAAINQAIQDGRLPGAVLVIGHDGHVVYRKAYGNRALAPQTEPMTVDTIFDCASLTKVVSTTSSLMKLFEQGKFRLNDRITQYIPEFQGGKSDITIRNLMTHFSGLQPDVPLKPEWSGYQHGIELAEKTPPAGPPGARFVYSDINFNLLGELVHRLSGQLVSDYARQHIFEPLGMHDTMFNPPASLIPRIAPTEALNGGAPLRGVVHDPTARYMGGVAGDAGMFSTADDMARFAQMLLNGEARQVVGGRKHSGIAGHAAHVACRGVVDHAAQWGTAIEGLGRGDARDQARGRIEHRVVHAERLEDVLPRVIGDELAAEPVDQLAQQVEIDVAINKAGAGRPGGRSFLGELDAVLIPAPLRLERHIRLQAGKVCHQVADRDVAFAALKFGDVLGNAVIEPELALLEQLHER